LTASYSRKKAVLSIATDFMVMFSVDKICYDSALLENQSRVGGKVMGDLFSYDYGLPRLVAPMPLCLPQK